MAFKIVPKRVSEETRVGSLVPLAVSVRDAARLLGVCERTVWSVAKRGLLPYCRVGGRVVFPREGIEAFLRGTGAAIGRLRGESGERNSGVGGGIGGEPLPTSPHPELSDEEYAILQDLADYLNVNVSV